MNHFGSVLHGFLQCKYQGCEYASGETYESIVWMDGNPVPKPTLEEVISGLEDYEAQYEKYQYKNLRSAEYKTTAEQLDMLWHAMDKGEIPQASEFYAANKAVKYKFPK